MVADLLHHGSYLYELRARHGDLKEQSGIQGPQSQSPTVLLLLTIQIWAKRLVP